MADKDLPLVCEEMSTPFGAAVIDLAEVRIRFGITDRKAGRPCEHRQLIYSQSERRVWCEGCERTIDSFDAFMTITHHFQAMERAVRSKLERAKAALEATVTRRAAKVIDRAWSGNQMAIQCPRCRAALLPEDFADGCAQTSAEIERARRKAATHDTGGG